MSGLGGVYLEEPDRGGREVSCCTCKPWGLSVPVSFGTYQLSRFFEVVYLTSCAQCVTIS